MIGRKTKQLNIFWVIAVIIALYMLYTGTQQYTSSAPTEEWIVDIVAGASILLICVAFIGYRLENGQPTTDQIGLTDWTVLVLFASWPIIGALLYVLGYHLPRIYFFSGLGIIGMSLTIYTMWFS